MDRQAAKHGEAANHRSVFKSMGKGGWRRDRAGVIKVRASRSVTRPHPECVDELEHLLLERRAFVRSRDFSRVTPDIMSLISLTGHSGQLACSLTLERPGIQWMCLTKSPADVHIEGTLMIMRKLIAQAGLSYTRS